MLRGVARRILVNAMSLWQGGSSKNYTTNLLRELGRDARGFEFAVILPRGGLSDAEAAGIERIEVDLPARGRSLARIAFEEFALPWRARRYDLLYCLADLLPLRSSAPVVVALRNLNLYDTRYYDDTRTRVLLRLVRLGLPRAAGIVTPSAAAARSIGGALGIEPSRFRVVPHGIDLAAFDATPRPASRGARPYLFYPANLERHKNFETLFDALGMLGSEAPDLWVAGSDRLEPHYGESLRRRARERGLGERVRFLGNVPYREVLTYYRGAAGLVFPTLLETFGHPMLEAMLAQTPILASDLPVCREVAGDAALYFPPTDAAALAQAIRALFADPAATARRVAIGRERVAGFGWKHSIDRLCAVFEDVLAAPRGAH